MINHYFACDVETTGLNHNKNGKIISNNLLSISFVLLDRNLNELVSNTYDIKVPRDILFDMDPYVFKMHCSTGLIPRIQSGECYNIDDVTHNILASIEPFLEKDEKIQPLGNNVQFDVEVIRREVPKLYELFHYSFLDVSSVRNALGLHIEEIPSLVYEFKKSNHDSMVDIRECLRELKLYLTFFNHFNIKDVKTEIKFMEDYNV